MAPLELIHVGNELLDVNLDSCHLFISDVVEHSHLLFGLIIDGCNTIYQILENAFFRRLHQIGSNLLKEQKKFRRPQVNLPQIVLAQYLPVIS